MNPTNKNTNTTTKVCKTCKIEKDLATQFIKRSDSNTYRGDCRDCHHKKFYGTDRKAARLAPTGVPKNHRLCFNCGNAKPSDEMFEYEGKIGNDCIDCVSAVYRSLLNVQDIYTISAEDETIEEGYKKCTKCGEVKVAQGNFQVRSDSGKFRNECDDCRKSFLKSYQKGRKDGSIKKKEPEVVVDGKKTCQYCFTSKPLEDLMKNARYESGRTNECKKCNNLRLRVYRLIRCLKDPAFKLGILVRCHISYGLKHRKVDKTIEYVGCNGQTLKEWLEFNMEGGMTWENHGTLWQMDHVIPVTKFDMSDAEQVKICFSWCNMRPMESKANNTKNNNVLPEQVQAHLISLENYKTKFEQNTMEYQALSESLAWLRR